ncbi:general secretion pathway protein GspG [Geothermobacter hydrogeniphilus]|uniref:General secretion pathway protein GspG n=2 Tax=Geothermobacter hydrogeniphilus TaxID=1969733 RepID=A0A2K2HCB8_9BACT|nr:general secretion pathway protein GspG [Geothermobacter hydrogeniphilus]
MAILAVLASAVLPMAEVTVKRTREIELQRSLRIVRHAIDAYKADFDRAVAEKKIIVSINDTGYPEGLEVLLEGKDWGGLYPFKKRYLRRIPKDPFDRYNEGWGLRSLEDDPDSTVWGGDNVYDIYSQSDAIGLDGTPYNTW